MTVDDYLAAIYSADRKNNKFPALNAFIEALTADPALKSSAQAKLTELNTMIKARGVIACTFSTKYRHYLKEALA